MSCLLSEPPDYGRGVQDTKQCSEQYTSKGGDVDRA